MNLETIENELRKRHKFSYNWGQKQNNSFDQATNFIYQIFDLQQLLLTIDQKFKHQNNYQIYFDYALNRWYNFWSAQAVEAIFCQQQGVKPALNEKNRLVDFTIQNIQFDHKTSVFPKGYPNNIAFAQQNPKNLITWLYQNQSQQQRMHLKNRLFIVLHKQNGQHWQLKSEILWLQDIIAHYVKNFDPQQLTPIQFDSSTALSDLIFAQQ